MANWEELPQGVLEHIACRLAIKDYIVFRGVCTSWRSAAAKEMYKAKPETLWFMTGMPPYKAEFSNLFTGRTYSTQLPRPHAETSTALGWIPVSDWGTEYLIFNPLSRVSIKLPSLWKLHHVSCLSAELPSLQGLGWGLRKINMIALSSSPSLSKSYTVMISYVSSTGVAFHRSGEDAWTVVSPPTHLRWSSLVRQLIYYDGKFVVLDTDGQIMTLNERERRMELRLWLDFVKPGVYPYLVECSGSLLVACPMRGDDYGHEKVIRVFKVDLQKGNHEEIKSLGNASLFLIGKSGVSVDFPAGSCLPGIKPNHVYFGDHFTEMSYSMEDGEFVTCPFTPSSNLHRLAWFQPNF